MMRHQLYSSLLLSAAVALGGFSIPATAQTPPIVIAQATAEDSITAGLEKYARQDYKGAIADFTQAIKLNPNYSLAYYNRGTCRRKLGDNKGAVEDFTKAIQINQNWGDKGAAVAYNNRGNARSDMGDVKGSLTDYDQAIRINPKYGLAYYNRGNAYSVSGNRKKAMEDYNLAIQYRPDLPEAYFNRAILKERARDRKGAVADYQKSADIYQEQGRMQDYQDAMQRIRELR
ncbi:MAG: tetratricopeptide repeat protein [Leptolyngbyaceae cyanobacterium bins.59]|nr:tetratricopeptide repeat protein [Leptolyngbyaceae cyanobacterium bins.59]